MPAALGVRHTPSPRLPTPMRAASAKTAAAVPSVAHPLARFVLFEAMPEAMLARLAPDTTSHHLKAGARLWRAGAAADHLTLIDHGIVAVERGRRSGEGVVLGLFGAGQSIGLPALLARIPYPAEALVLSAEADIVRVRAPAVLQLMREQLSFALAINQALLQHNAALRASIDIIGAGAVPKRLAALFLQLGSRFGRKDAAGALHITVPLTREQIGRLVSARVETVIRIISRWQKAGWLRSARDEIEITRVDMLQRMVDAG